MVGLLKVSRLEGWWDCGGTLKGVPIRGVVGLLKVSRLEGWWDS